MIYLGGMGEKRMEYKIIKNERDYWNTYILDLFYLFQGTELLSHQIYHTLH